jgi:hypothetical protein
MGTWDQTATALPDGRLLVTGGVNGAHSQTVATTEFFDPATGHWSPGPTMLQARFAHGAVLLADGQVLLAGGGVATSDLLTP